MKVTRKLFVSMLAVVFAIVALGASTYAWFTLTGVNTVGDIELTVTSGVGLEMSLDGVSYKSNLSKEDIEEAIGGSLLLQSVTTTDVSTFKKFTGVVSGAATYTTNDTKPIANQAYIFIPIWFKATYVTTAIETATPGVYLIDELSDTHNAGSPVTYDSPSTSGSWIVSKGVSFKPTVTFTDEAGTPLTSSSAAVTKYAGDAARVGFITSNKIDPTEASSETLSGGVIFDLSSTASATNGYGKENGAVSFYNAKNPTSTITSTILSTLAINNEKTTLTSAFSETGVATVDNNSLITSLVSTNTSTHEWTGKVYLAVWLEGWDSDCYDAVLEDKLLCQLNFKLAGIKA